MTRAHYIVRVGNEGIAPKISASAPNHWHYLSPQHLWGLPRNLPQVKVRASFEADIENPQVTAYIWFLCNGHGGAGHFLQVGIGRRHLGQGPVQNRNLPIPEDMMARLQQGFDHWFEWRPVSGDAAFQDQVRQVPVPLPHYISTLRRVTADHLSFPTFETLIGNEERRIAAGATTALPTALPNPPAIQAAAATTVLPEDVPTAENIEDDLENIRRERNEPHSEGHIYLIHMEGTTFYKIGMSLDPLIRLRTLQTGNPRPLHLLYTRNVHDMRSAEVSLHQQFENLRVPNLNVREWFDFNNGTGEVESAFSTLE
ncbi:hypothetical protein MMC06_002710 [Schaereria dolodes]|nr:hypothetical protein [Schaereria dolodes]